MNKFKDKKEEGGIQIGTSSLVVIFVILALTVFAVLSLTGVLADDRLSDRAAEWTTAYYEADSKAEDMLKDINQAIDAQKSGVAGSTEDIDSKLNDITGGGYDSQKGRISFRLPINEKVVLGVELELLDTPKDGKYYRILKWQEVFVGEYEIDDDMPVWDGTFE